MQADAGGRARSRLWVGHEERSQNRCRLGDTLSVDLSQFLVDQLLVPADLQSSSPRDSMAVPHMIIFQRMTRRYGSPSAT